MARAEALFRRWGIFIIILVFISAFTMGFSIYLLLYMGTIVGIIGTELLVREIEIGDDEDDIDRDEFVEALLNG